MHPPIHRLIILALLSAVRAIAADISPAIISSEFINENASYPECHASTLAEITPGKIVAAWFGGTKERNPDVGIWFARQENNRWLPATEVANGLQPDAPRLPTWNPVLFQAPNGPLILFYKVGPSPSQWWGMMISSRDGGKTWTAPRRLPSDILGPVKNKPIILRDGTWLAGSSTEGAPAGRIVHFEKSSDGGQTWKLIGPVAKGQPSLSAIQPTLLQHRDGTLQALCRTSNGVIATTTSRDDGATWSALSALALPNPNSGIDAITLADGRHLLVYNHSAPPPERPDKGVRYPLDIAISTDGIKWDHVLTLESEPRGNGYVYPAVIQTSDGLVHTTYTWDRKKIKHVVIAPRKL
jgi:predicted neuraminidase